MPAIEATPGYRMNVLIRRRAGVSRDELVANWFANHMPGVVKVMANAALAAQPHAHRYIATLFDADASGNAVWDGIAQLWWKLNLGKPPQPHGTKPADTFQQKAEPYLPWWVREYVVMDGALPLTPNTLNEPFPCTRSGFFKVTFLMKTQAGADRDAFFAHWLGTHAANVSAVMKAVGGFRYVIAQTVEPAAEEFAGMAELYFPNAEAWARFRAEIKPDGMERWVDAAGTLLFTGGTEMVGIPG
jgi:EthD domain